MPVVNIPPATPCNDQYTSFGVAAGSSGAEGCKAAPFTLTWNALTAGTSGYAIDFGGRPNMPAQICTLYVDNTRCHLGVHILFPDTGFRLLVPAFRRGYYPVLTRATSFYAGILPGSTPVAGDVTVIEALNFSAPPIENEAFLDSLMGTQSFDPSASVGSTFLIPQSTNFILLRGLTLQLSGLTGGAAGATFLFQLLADGVVVAQAGLQLGAAEFVDAGELLHLDGLKQSALAWTYTWTLSAGALTGAAIDIMEVS